LLEGTDDDGRQPANIPIPNKQKRNLILFMAITLEDKDYFSYIHFKE